MATGPQYASDQPLEVLLGGALEGHRAAWEALVGRLERVVWKTVNMLTSDREIRDDAFAATWLRLAERLDSIREPEKLPGWMTTTARNEVRQIVRRRNRQHLSLNGSFGSGDAADGDLVDTLTADDGEHADGLISNEQHGVVRTTFAQLDEQCREIISVLVLADPPLTYDEASALLGRPVGSLGPSRRRCLDKMRTLLEDHHGGSP
ncbi:MAG: sigma-70 family RNA polymerase sigma factor [Ilumatobacteraceae bacterium]